MALITGVYPHSPAEKAGILPGMHLLSINGHKITDVLDYKFYSYDPKLVLTLETSEAESFTAHIKKSDGEDIGVTFESYLMDSQKRCSNKCIFCFIDQLPPNMRESLYFKDDDARMSFLSGSYITLTNLTDEDAQRIINMRISPLNISVQTTNPDLRTFMLGTKRGGESLTLLDKFVRSGLAINAQIVVCPGINDGTELQRTLNDLMAMYPSVKSVSVVPVGITKHREGLYPLSPMDTACAADVIKLTDSFGDKCLREFGTRIFYPADELYIKAGLPLPAPEYYEDYPQLENGVGLIALLRDDFLFALEDRIAAGSPPVRPRKISIATGVAAAPYIKELTDKALEWAGTIDCRVFAVKNELFGETVDVAGLLCGQDIANALTGEDLGEELLLPACMFRHETDIFLDDMDIGTLETRLGTKITKVSAGGDELLAAILGE